MAVKQKVTAQEDERSGTRSMEERLQLVLDELDLGRRWKRPNLIVLVYRSEITKKTVTGQLVSALGKAGLEAISFQVDRKHYDIPLELAAHPRHDRAVFMVSGIQHGGGRGYSQAYRALNLHRENLVEAQVKLLLWVSTGEARQLPRFAPDLWAFRHLVVEFRDLPDARPGLVAVPSLALSAWPGVSSKSKGVLAAAEQALALGCVEEVVASLKKMARTYPGEPIFHLRLAEVQMMNGEIQAARRALNQAGRRAGLPQEQSARVLADLHERLKTSVPRRGGFLELEI